jgi:hypothetical protein
LKQCSWPPVGPVSTQEVVSPTSATKWAVLNSLAAVHPVARSAPNRNPCERALGKAKASEAIKPRPLCYVRCDHRNQEPGETITAF